MKNILTHEFWDVHYQQKDTPWDMGRVSPPLQMYFDQLTDRTRSIIIPGCGNAYEASYLLEAGFTDVTLIDISPVLVAHLRQQLRQYTDQSPAPLKVIEGDFFAFLGQYDLIIEQTFLSALDPFLRPSYAHQMARLLKPGGKLAGLYFDREFPEGPPFGGNQQEYRTLLEQAFHIQTMASCYNSIPPRAGTEVFFIAVRK